MVITPVVLALEGRAQPRRSPDEVAALHPVAVSRLTAPGVPRCHSQPGGEKFLQMLLRHDMIIHAPTGAIPWQFVELALRGPARHVHHLAQPGFTPPLSVSSLARPTRHKASGGKSTSR